MYATETKGDILLEFPNYKWRYLQNVATQCGAQRLTNGKRCGDMRCLLNNSVESSYWLGLIATDGYISPTGDLKVELAVKDCEYLNGLAEYLGAKISTYPPYGSSKGGTGTCRVKIKDHVHGVNIREMFKIVGKKTYNPINIDFINTADNLLALLGGYIDGDGSITNNKIHINAHINHEYFMIDFGDRLKGYNIITDYTVTTYEKMCSLNITTYDTLHIKNGLIKLKLPIMKRKWDKVSPTPLIKNYLVEHDETIMELRNGGATLSEICDKIGYKSVGTLSGYITNRKN